MSETIQWYEANERYLRATLAEVRLALEGGDHHPLDQPLWPSPAEIAQEETAFPALCAATDPQRPYPTFGLALATLPQADRRAFTPTAPLRRWGLIQVEPSDRLLTSRLRLDERILHYLVGGQHLDEHLLGLVELAPIPDDLVPSHRALAEQIATAWSWQCPIAHWPVIQLHGPDWVSQRAIAAVASAMTGLYLYVMTAPAVPRNPREQEALMRLWQREAALGESALLLDMGDKQPEAWRSWLSRLGPTPLMTASRRPLGAVRERAVLTLQVPQPTAAEQRHLWQELLEPLIPHLNGQVDQLVARFDLPAPAIHEIGAALPAPTDWPAVWTACRQHLRRQLDPLAQRLNTAVGWGDLLLPTDPHRQLRDVVAYEQQCRFAENGHTLLLVGVAGTGKTTTARALANALQRDLYSLDLASTPPAQWQRLFETAASGGVVVLLEAANACPEWADLPQRLTAHRGLVILTAHHAEALPAALLSSVDTVIHLPLPTTAQRLALWRRALPAETSLPLEMLARLPLTGGAIAQMTRYATLLAADAGEPLIMTHLRRAAQAMAHKLGDQATALIAWME